MGLPVTGGTGPIIVEHWRSTLANRYAVIPVTTARSFLWDVQKRAGPDNK